MLFGGINQKRECSHEQVKTLSQRTAQTNRVTVQLRPEPRRRLRYLADVAALMATPLVPADYLDMFDPLRAGARELRGKVTAIQRLTPDAVAIDIRPGRSWSGHVAGQYVRVGVEIAGVRHWRTYSLTSPAPARGSSHRDHHPEPLSIGVKEVPDGLVSSYLNRDLAVGDLIHLGQATGSFVFPDPMPSRVVFVTGGSGITPVLGILRTLATRPGLRTADDAPPDIVVIHGARHRDDVMFGPELRALAAGPLRGVLTLHERYSDEEGFLTPERIEALVGDLRERAAYSCGPAGLVDLVTAMAADGRTGPLTTEPFTPPPVVTGAGGTAVLDRTGTSLEVDGSTSILDAADAAGAVLPSGCRMGICFRCVVPLVDGAVSDLRTGDITLAADGVTVQTCISAPAGSCRVVA